MGRYCPSRPGELPKLFATEYRIQPDVSPCISVLRGRGVQDCPLLRCRRRLLIRTMKGVTRAKETICCTEMSRKNLEQNQPSPPSRDFVGRPRHSCRPPCSSSSSAAPSGSLPVPRGPTTRSSTSSRDNRSSRKIDYQRLLLRK